MPLTTNPLLPRSSDLTGEQAVEILRIARDRLRDTEVGSWAEVAMSRCTAGCKTYARYVARQPGVQFAVLHSSAYGCAFGRDPLTREQPVTVTVAPPPNPSVPLVNRATDATTAAVWDDSLAAYQRYVGATMSTQELHFRKVLTQVARGLVDEREAFAIVCQILGVPMPLVTAI